MANIKLFIVVLILSSVSGDIIKESMLNFDEKHTYTLDLVWLKELWHRAGVMALIKAKAKSILKSDSYISLHERLVYRHCEKEALTPVALAKCIVSLMNARDRALSPVNEQTNDAITFWDVFMPWKKLTNFKAFAKTIQTTTSSPDSPNYDLTPLKKPSLAPRPFIKERLRLKIFMKKSMKKVDITKHNQRRIYATRIRSEGMPKYPTNIYSSQPMPSYGYSNQRMPSYIYPSPSMPFYKYPIQSMRSYSSPSKSVPSYSTRFAKYRLKDIDNYGPSVYFQPQRSPLPMIPRYSYYQTRQKRNVQQESIPSNGLTNKLTSIEKLKILKEYTQMQQHVQAFSKKMNSENSKFLRKKGFPFVYETEKPRKLNFAEDVIDLVNGYLRKANMTEFDELNLLSPRIMPLFSKYDNENRPGLLSPTLLSFQKDGFLSWPDILQLLTGSNKLDSDEWLDLILTVSGGDKALDKTLRILKNDIKEMKEKIYPEILEMEQMERDWTRISYLHSNRQKRSLDKYGYTFLEPHQIELAYKNRFTPNHELNLTEYAKMSPYERDQLLEDDIRNIAKLDRLFDRYGNYINNRHKRQTPVTDLTPKFNVLAPAAFSNRINQGLIMKANILSPTAFVTEINNLVAMVHLTLSPTVFSAAVLNPSILFSRVLSPVAFRAEVMHPRILHAWVLSPTAFAARVLSPRILQARIGSSLSMIINILSPGIIHPRVFSPDGPAVAILSPQIWSPRFGSTNHMLINILSPPIMSDPIDEPKNGTTMQTSPWQLLGK